MKGVGGVTILLVEKWVDKVIEVVRVCDRVLKLRLVLQNITATIISAYIPQAGLPNDQKDHFYDILLQTASKTSGNDLIFVAGDRESGIFHGVHRGHGFGSWNDEETSLLEFCDACNILICNTKFRHPPDNLLIMGLC
ncbi:uncharacterized protein LOC115222341 [Octopus sinensis]|uniref:Uncharacterized protein LOC115222341 n=1 Tax=Octopus sinensis TaxID=2607531 RepID=A0A6P7TDJ2_9MOLL|nr:uncharacterized protein LOC115222341 [Octopus sinensis]